MEHYGNLIDECLKLDENVRKSQDIAMIWEGNYWDDQDVHDCCDIDWNTLNFLVSKVTIAIQQYELEKSEKILIYLPKVIQLPITILASYQAGIVPVIVDPLLTLPSELAPIISKFSPKLLITVDAFWQGQELREIKRNVERYETQILVIRHVAPNYGVPPPRKHLPARRPYYKIELDLRNGKDDEWSTVMSKIEPGTIPKNIWRPEQTIAILTNSDNTENIVTNSEIVNSLREKSKNYTNCIKNILVLDFPRNLDTLTHFLLPFFTAKTLTLYEGPLDYPDSSRLSQIIQKHQVDCIVSLAPVNIPNPEYLQFFDFGNLKKLISTSKILEEAYNL